MTGYLRLSLRVLFSVACVLLIIVLMGITWSIGARRTTRAIMRTAFKAGADVWGIHVRVEGTIARDRPLLVVSNHFSYLDLFVLGSVLPVAFTPKREIRSWPVIGFMCKVSGCLFIDRRATRTLENKKLLEAALKAGDIISLFPEGTTSDGTGLLPFKSSFFSLAQETSIRVQPVSVVYTGINGKPVTSADLPIIGWYGDAYFFPHVMRFLQQKGVEAKLVFHVPVSASQFASRKELALYCREVIAQGLWQSADQKNAPETSPGAQNQTMEGNSVMPQLKQ